MKHKHQIVILGGGTAGITVAARLKRANKKLDIAIVEPSSDHYYQPLWTLVGAGIASRDESVRPEKRYIPKGVQWYQETVRAISASEQSVTLNSGNELSYDYLVAALGIQLDWDKVDQLPESLGKGGVVSNYSFQHVEYTWEVIRNFKGGDALFTAPGTPVKCGGAPQKVMYLAESAFRRQGVRDQSNVIFTSAGSVIFGVEKYRPVFQNIVDTRNIKTRFHLDLKALRPKSNEAIYEDTENDKEVVLHYDMIHVVPPMSAPDVIKQSDIADEKGWVAVDKHTLQHDTFPNVFALGDNSNTPNGKTGAAVRKQAPVLVKNLLAHMNGKELSASYNGYSSCPVVTDYGKLVLAEFDYDSNPQETFPFNQAKERYSMYLLKRHILPKLYWYGMLRGRA